MQMTFARTLQSTFMAFCAIPAAMAQSCIPVDAGGARGGTTGSVSSVGKYCLHADLEQPESFDIHAMRFKTFKGAGLLSIIKERGDTSTGAGGPGLDIDLQGHTLQAKPKNMIGIRDNARSEHVRIHNGSILVPGTEEPNIGIDLQSLQSPRMAYARSTSGNKAPPYRETRNLVEQVKVHAGWLGVQMVGIGNTLRNSVIEADGRSAVAMFGPGSVIENNTIIVHGNGEITPNDGAITLWDGTGAVIRNNRFIFKGSDKKAPPAIRLIDSNGVQLDGNTFEGFDQPVSIGGAK